MIKKRYYQLLFTANGTTWKRNLKFSRFRIAILSMFILVLTGSIIYLSSHLIATGMTHQAMTEVMTENRELHSNISRLNERLSDVDEQLGKLADSDDQLRLLADMPQIDKDTREVGIGGAIKPNLPRNDQTVQKLIFDIDKIEREIRLQVSSFIEIERQFNEKEDLIAHTPSIRPVEGGFCSSKFGYRRDPFTHRRTYHKGMDFCVERGTPVRAPADGIVVFAKRTPGLGKLIVIDHGYDIKTAFGHLSKIQVSKGSRVGRGQKIGEVGNTGRSTAPHLHYEVRKDGKPVDPVDYLFHSYAKLPTR